MLTEDYQSSINMERVRYVSRKTDRKVYEAKKRERFFKRFEDDYGQGSVDEFKEIIEDPSSSLAEIGRYYGFSRENARLIYRKIYGFPYTQAYKKKLEARRKVRERLRQGGAVKLKRKRRLYIDKVMQKAESLGFSAMTRSTGNPNNILINGYKVNIKGAPRPIQVNKNGYFSISRTNLERKDCDFFICLCRSVGNDTYYVIPYDAMPKYGANMPVDKHGQGEKRSSTHRSSKYSQFKEAWDLITKSGEQRAEKYQTECARSF